MSVAMSLLDLRTEILNHGFDPINFPASRLNRYINDGLSLIARRVDYYADESSQTFQTTAGNGTLLYPTDLARLRTLFDTDRNLEITQVSQRMIDRSPVTQGQPLYYSDGKTGLTLYPTPDGVYNLLLRYWQMPATLVNDTDTPSLPTDWQHLLWVYATWICFESEDDAQMAQYWQQRFNAELSEFAADQKFPSTEYPSQAESMWDQGRSLGTHGWSIYGWGW